MWNLRRDGENVFFHWENTILRNIYWAPEEIDTTTPPTQFDWQVNSGQSVPKRHRNERWAAQMETEF